MAYLNDTEKRLLLSALHREKGICKVIDEQKSDGILLAPFVESLGRKFCYDRFEKEIRNKAIDECLNEFANWYGSGFHDTGYCRLLKQMKENDSNIDFMELAVEWNGKSSKKVPYEFIEWLESQMKEGAE